MTTFSETIRNLVVLSMSVLDFHTKRYCSGNDQVSQLPDEILIDILSLLPLKQAACTSVLSSRWMNLWKHTSCLDFDADSALDKIEEQPELLDVGRDKYVEWVNRVLRSHKANRLKEFRACFDLSQSYSKSITRWLEFALERHVQKLELDLSLDVIGGIADIYYAFPEEFLTRASAGASMSKSLSASDSSCIDFKSLKELSLRGVKLTGRTIESLLRICPLLEKLDVDVEQEMWNLEICGPSLILKHLELRSGFGIKFVKISAPNLTTLIVERVDNILLENVPLLVKVSLDYMCYPHTVKSVKNLLPTLSCCISQLETLTLMLDGIQKENVLSMFPELPKLKKLDISYMTREEINLMGLTHLIRASPCLQEFFVDVVLSTTPSRFNSEVRNTTPIPHNHLKMFEFCGYCGCSSDVELVKYILENSVVLEKITVVLYELPIGGYSKQQLEALVPQHIKLVIA